MVFSISEYEKSSTYKFIKDVQKVTKPLEQLGITYFIYAELKEDYYISCLVNNDKMIRDFINYNGLKYELSLSPYGIINDGVYSVSTIKKSPQIKNYYDLLFKFNEATDQIVYIINHNDIRKVYIFGVSAPFYINKEYLELFILYFNDKARFLINNSEQVRIPKEFAEYNIELESIKNFIVAKMEQDFLNSINAKYYKIKQLEQQYCLTLRETQCLKLILENKIAREIADFLNLRTRTIETYIDNLKKKLDCHTKHEIMIKFFIK